MVTKRPTTTGGSPMPVLIMLTTICRPGNRVRATAVPDEMPRKRLTRVAVPETLSDSRVIPRTSGSRETIRAIAFRMPSKISSIYFPSSSTFFPASGKNRGAPYFSTPKVLMIFWVAGSTMKLAKALAPAALTFGHLAWLTSMT